MEKINLFLGTRYWYHVRFIYKNKVGERLFDWTAEIGLSEKRTILKKRVVKKISLPLHKIKDMPKYLFCNGNLSVETITYLGWFRGK